jgi:serine/threonine protein kinase
MALLSGSVDTRVSPYNAQPPVTGCAPAGGSPPVTENPRIGAFILKQLLGQGSYGAVYRATHACLKKDYAVKVLAGTAGTAASHRFELEMRVLAACDHPNIIRVTDGGRDADRRYLAMEYARGGSLANLLKDRGGRLSIAEACRLIGQTAVGLTYLHRRGIVHRDIKLANLLVSGSGVVKIADFGLVRVTCDTSERTLPNTPLGTPVYMAPEAVVDAHTVCPEADVYSLGCSLYILIAGNGPFPEVCGPTQQMNAHLCREAPSVRQFRADAPPVLDQLLARMLARDPKARPAAAEVAKALVPLFSMPT